MPTAVPGYRGHLDSFAFPAHLARDGTVLVAAGPQTLDVWDLTTTTLRNRVAHDATGADETGATSPDGRWHAITGRLGTRLFDLDTGARGASIDTNGGYVEFSPDSSARATATRCASDMSGREGPLDEVATLAAWM